MSETTTQTRTPILDELIDQAMEAKRQREQEEREAKARAAEEHRRTAMTELSERLDPLFDDGAAEAVALSYTYDDDAHRAYATVSDGSLVWRIAEHPRDVTQFGIFDGKTTDWVAGCELQQSLLEHMGERREQRRVDAQIAAAMKGWSLPSA